MTAKASGCYACIMGDHARCDYFINEGAVDAEDFIAMPPCECHDLWPDWHEGERNPEFELMDKRYKLRENNND